MIWTPGRHHAPGGAGDRIPEFQLQVLTADDDSPVSDRIDPESPRGECLRHGHPVAAVEILDEVVASDAGVAIAAPQADAESRCAPQVHDVVAGCDRGSRLSSDYVLEPGGDLEVGAGPHRPRGSVDESVALQTGNLRHPPTGTRQGLRAITCRP